MRMYSAIKIAHQHIDAKVVSTMLRDLASCVVLSSKQINTKIILDVINIKEEKIKYDVYCLTTSQGAFKLNSECPIVSNCDAYGYAVVKLFPIRRPISSKTSLSMRN